MKIKLNRKQRLIYEALKLSSQQRARAYREQFRLLRSQSLDNLKSLRDGPVIVAGFMSSSIGLGVAVRKLVASLRSVQIEPRIHDLSAAFKQPQIYPDWCKSIDECPEGGTVILCVNPLEIPHALNNLPARILEGRWLIGYFWWELEQIPIEWLSIVRQFDEVWVSSGFVYSAFSSHMHNFELSLFPISIDVDGPEPRRRTGGEFVVLSASDLNSWPQRKNPEGAVQAFVKAFGRDPNARLIIKIQNARDLDKRLPSIARIAADNGNVELIAENFSEEQFKRLLERTDVILSLHRSEGLGLIPLEGMAIGKVVVATNWGGSCDYLDAASGIPISYKLRPIAEGEYAHVPPGSRWAEPDIDEAASWLRILRADPDLCLRLGTEARRRVALQYGLDKKRHIIKDLVSRHRQNRKVANGRALTDAMGSS